MPKTVGTVFLLLWREKVFLGTRHARVIYGILPQ